MGSPMPPYSPSTSTRCGSKKFHGGTRVVMQVEHVAPGTVARRRWRGTTRREDRTPLVQFTMRLGRTGPMPS